MKPTRIGTRKEWLVARLALLEKEKAHSRARDELTRERQALPWVKIEKKYTFDSPGGRVTLAELFGDKNQLLIQHFMFDPEWDQGCKSCSFMADHLDRSVVHIAHRDTAYAAVSRASLEKLEQFKKRMGWSFRWVSSGGSDFNRDFNVSFSEDEIEKHRVNYNFREGITFPGKEAPGLSAFARDDGGAIYHTYSVYGRGLEKVIGAYDLLDMVPKGRDEKSPMDWLRLKDKYEV